MYLLILFRKIFRMVIYKKMLTKNIIIKYTPAKVFAYMDNIGNTGMHMTKSSTPMMGNKLELKQLSENATGLNSKFNWS